MNVPPDYDVDFGTGSDWAQVYRQHHIQVVPAKDKKPNLPAWKALQGELASQDLFNTWYGPRGVFVSSMNMGMLTGPCSNYTLMIDLDEYKEAGQATIWWNGLLEIHNNGLPLETWTQRTGGGGRQMFFSYPPTWLAPTTKTPIGVDFRGNAGFAVLPPTLHASGRQYEWLEGYAPWDCERLPAPQWLLDEVLKLAGTHFSAPEHTGNGKLHAVTLPYKAGGDDGPGVFDAFGQQYDLREDKMYKHIWAAVVGYRIESTIPLGDHEREQIWQDYYHSVTPKQILPGESKNAALEREHRGRTEFKKKWDRACSKWFTDVLYAAQERQTRESIPETPTSAKTPENVLEYLDVRQIKAQPDPLWAIDGLVGEGALGFIFGPPSSLKTFIAVDIALSMTTTCMTWWGRKLNVTGAVIYLCREGTTSLKFRIMAWEKHRGVCADDAPFYLIKHPLNFMRPDDVDVLRRTIKEIAAKIVGPIAAIFIDTVSRVLPGAEENQQKDMTLFTSACEIIQHEFKCIVAGIHHTNKDGFVRGSTVIPGAADFLIETKRQPGEMHGSIFVHKVKDGEDGFSVPFKVTKVTVGLLAEKSSLMVDHVDTGEDKTTSYTSRKEGLESALVRKGILEAMQQAWRRGEPWTVAPNSKRPAWRSIQSKWGGTKEEINQMLDRWVLEEVVEVSIRDHKLHVSGYRIRNKSGEEYGEK